MSGRPASLEAERGVLGAVLLDNETLYYCGQLSANDFLTDSARRTFAAISALAEDGKPIDLVTVSEELMRRGDYQAVGASGYISSLSEGVIARNVEHYVRSLREASARRRLIQECQRAIASAEGLEHPSEVAGVLQEALWTLAGNEAESETRHVLPIVHEVIDELNALRAHTGQLAGFTTGIDGLDATTTGIRPGELWVIAGRTGEGKSCLATQMGYANSVRDIPVGMFAVEMTDRQTIMRMATQQSGVPSSHLRAGAVTDAEMDKFCAIAKEIASLPIYINDASNLHIREFQARASLMVKRYKCRLIIVDHIHEMTADARDPKERLTAIASGLRIFAKQSGAAVVALAQMPRPRDGDPNRHPTKYDLKESGELENKAHTVVLIYRPTIDDSAMEFTGEDEMVVGKQRNGPVGSVPVTFLQRSLTFVARV